MPSTPTHGYRSKPSLPPERSRNYTTKLQRLKPLLGKLRLSDVNEAAIATAVGKLRKPDGRAYAPNTVVGTLVPLSCLLDDAVGEGILGHNPLASLKARQKGKRRKGNLIPRARNLKEQRILSPKEIDSLLSTAKTDRYRVLLTTAIFTGLRQMELLGLTWGDVDFEERIVRVRFQLSRLGGRVPYTKSDAGQRDVAIPDELVRMLREYRASTSYKSDGDHLFTTSTGKPIGWNNVDRDCLRATVKAAKLRSPWPTFHDLRHTFASLLIANGCDAKTVSTAMGHADAGFTLRVYTGLFDREASDEKVRAATRGNWQVTGQAGNGQEAATGQVVPFPGNPHASELPAAQSS